MLDKEKENYELVYDTIKFHVSDLEYLDSAYKQDWTSLGVIKPELIGYKFRPNEDYIPDTTRQLNLDSKKAFAIAKLEEKFQYSFKCGGDNCTGHTIVCIDIEVGQLYRNCLDYPIDIRHKKVADRLFTWMKERRDLYFIVGTHARYPSWLITGLFYPEKSATRQRTLDDF